MRIIFDIETDNLLEELTKAHCLCYYDYDTRQSVNLTSYEDIIALLSQNDLTLIGHNIIRFDIPALEKVLGIVIKAKLIDTLALSWYLYPERKKHGLEGWGEDFGVPKPAIEFWTKPDDVSEDEFQKTMLFRCSEDVKINTVLFENQLEKLKKIYTNGGIDKLFAYLTFKLQCAREQENVKWRLDTEKCQTVLTKLEADKTIKVQALIQAMPENVKYGKTVKPGKLFVKDGSISAQGQKWFYLLGQRGLPIDHEEDIEIEILREPGNPGSHQQLKDWLFSLGWVPQEFKYVKEEDEQGRQTNRKIPQINTQDDGICPSIKLLFEANPALRNLESLFIIAHRITILRGWLRDIDDNNFLSAEIAGLTNTLRFQHKTLVNIPTVNKPYGTELRECLIAPDEDNILCGSDLSGAEESTKHHYMSYYDPEYVKEMRTPGFDPHLDIAVLSKSITQDQADFYKSYGKENRTPISNPEEEKKTYGNIKFKRSISKKVNFAATYGAGPPKIALTAVIPVSEAKMLHATYWKRNKAVKQIAKDTYHKTVDDQMWLFNPVSKLWYSLRFEKDKFSTLNQGTAVYCFDTWVRYIRQKGIKMCGQFHDEIIFPLLPQDKDNIRQLLITSMEQANEELNLNVKLSISVDFGHNYAEIH